MEPVSGSEELNPSTIRILEVVCEQTSAFQNLFCIGSHFSQKGLGTVWLVLPSSSLERI